VDLADNMFTSLAMAVATSSPLQGELTACDAAGEAPILNVSPSSTSEYAWVNTPDWQVLSAAVIKDAPVIARVSSETGVEPRLIVAQIVGEQMRIYNSERALFESAFAPLKILGSETQFSLGVTGIKEQTAEQVEQNLTASSSVYYPGPTYEHLLDFSTSDPTTERVERITDQHDHYYSYLYTALYLKEVMAQWSSAGFDISARPEILSTLYNLGFTSSHPNATPHTGGTAITINGKTIRSARWATSSTTPASSRMYSRFPQRARSGVSFKYMDPHHPEITDEALAVSAQGNSDEAFGVLIERYQGRLLRYGKRFLSDNDHIEDVVQGVFIQTYQNIRSFDATRRFSPWIYRIAHNAFVNELRRQHREPVSFVDFDVLAAILARARSGGGDGQEGDAGVGGGWVGDAPAIYKEIIILYYIEELSYQEIADILRVPLGTVSVRLRRGREALKKAMEKNPFYRDHYATGTRHQNKSSRKDRPRRGAPPSEGVFYCAGRHGDRASCRRACTFRFCAELCYLQRA